MTIALSPSSDAWVAAACADLPTLLVDHAHCEKKAAHTAVRFLFKYPEWPNLVGAMSKLAREELVHFDQVLREMKARGIAMRSQISANYAGELFAASKRLGPVGELLACALIEARSHERFVRLADKCPDAGLAQFYGELAEAEARHGGIYLELAEELAGASAQATASGGAPISGASIAAPLAELTAREAEIVSRPGQPLRMHSG